MTTNLTNKFTRSLMCLCVAVSAWPLFSAQAVTRDDMEHARTVAAKTYLRWANNGSGYLDDKNPTTLVELEKIISAHPKDVDNLRAFKKTAFPADFESWDKAKLVEFWSVTAFSAPGLNKEGASQGARAAAKSALSKLTPAAPKPATPEGTPEKDGAAVAKPTDSIPAAVPAEMNAEQTRLDSIADALETEPLPAKRTENSYTWVYVVALCLLIGAVIALVAYASKAMKNSEKAERKEIERERLQSTSHTDDTHRREAARQEAERREQLRRQQEAERQEQLRREEQLRRQQEARQEAERQEQLRRQQEARQEAERQEQLRREEQLRRQQEAERRVAEEMKYGGVEAEYQQRIAEKDAEIDGLHRKISGMENERVRLEAENTRLMRELELLRARLESTPATPASSPAQAPTQTVAPIPTQPAAPTVAPAASISASAPTKRTIFLGRVNQNGLFVRADRALNPGLSLYVLETEDNFSGTFRVANDPSVFRAALPRPVEMLDGGCVAKDIKATAGMSAIVTESAGTAIFENNCWRVIRKARIRYT